MIRRCKLPISRLSCVLQTKEVCIMGQENWDKDEDQGSFCAKVSKLFNMFLPTLKKLIFFNKHEYFLSGIPETNFGSICITHWHDEKPLFLKQV